jgi:hypothetical protein
LTTEGKPQIEQQAVRIKLFGFKPFNLQKGYSSRIQP